MTGSRPDREQLDAGTRRPRAPSTTRDGARAGRSGAVRARAAHQPVVDLRADRAAEPAAVGAPAGLHALPTGLAVSAARPTASGEHGQHPVHTGAGRRAAAVMA